MDPGTGRFSGWQRSRLIGACLAALALAIQSSIPLIIVFGISIARPGERLQPLPSYHATAPHHQLPGTMSGHADQHPGSDRPRRHHNGHTVCPVCHCLGVGAVFAPPPLGIALAAPRAIGANRPLPVTPAAKPLIATAAYSPRAPPPVG